MGIIKRALQLSRQRKQTTQSKKMGKIDILFAKESIQITNKHMKRCPILLVNGMCELKP